MLLRLLQFLISILHVALRLFDNSVKRLDLITLRVHLNVDFFCNSMNVLKNIVNLIDLFITILNHVVHYVDFLVFLHYRVSDNLGLSQLLRIRASDGRLTLSVVH